MLKIPNNHPYLPLPWVVLQSFTKLLNPTTQSMVNSFKKIEEKN
jgi:hypothetical protein